MIMLIVCWRGPMLFGSKVQTINIFKFLKQKSSENHGIVNTVKTAKPVVKGYYN